MDNKFERCEADDPDRCQGIGGHGQCPYKRLAPHQFCARHGGAIAEHLARKEEARNYRLAKWNARVGQMADNPQVKCLREEIGILRMLLEETLNSCKSQYDLFLNNAKISDLVLKIEKLVSSCHRLEASTGALLDKSAVLNIATVIIQIIGNHVADETIVDKIAGEILTSVEQQKIEVKA